jgi:putative ABC transport system permease protein
MPPLPSHGKLVDVGVRRANSATRLLLKCGATANCCGDGGGSPLHEAAGSGQMDFAELLLAYGANINAKAERRKTPLGKRLRFGTPDQPWSEVVGVVANLKHDGLQLADSPHCYAPHLQQPWPFVAVALRSSLETSALLSAVRQTVQQLDPKLPLIEPLPMTARMERTLATRRLTLTLYSLFAVIALLLATIGLYGVMAYGVAQRTHKLGIRIAMGATARDVFSLILRQGMALVALGVAVGIVGARLVSGWLAAQLFGVTPADPLTFAALAVLLALVGLLACWIPARRATKVDPMIALRTE